MTSCLHAILGLLVLQIYVSAAPNNITQVEEPKEINNGETELDLQENEQINNEEPRLDSQPLHIKESKNEDNSTQNLRQKRFYNFYGYGIPPINPIVYPSYNKRDQSADTGVYGLVEDPLDQIHKRLQDIASLVRQPVPPPPPPPVHFPFFFPVIYIPQYSCNCFPDNTTPQTQPQRPQTENPQPGPQTSKPEQNETTPDIVNRVPPMEDELNWGIMTNETDPEYDEDEFRRPISFAPFETNVPTMRPAPPVDHGSSQEGSRSDRPDSMTTMMPPNPPGGQGSALSSQGRPTTTRRPAVQDSPPYPASFSPTNPRNEQPSACDGAVLSCCHQLQVSYDCFVLQGCPDPTSYGNPCHPGVILQVIEKFQKFYGVRNV